MNGIFMPSAGFLRRFPFFIVNCSVAAKYCFFPIDSRMYNLTFFFCKKQKIY